MQGQQERSFLDTRLDSDSVGILSSCCRFATSQPVDDELCQGISLLGAKDVLSVSITLESDQFLRLGRSFVLLLDASARCVAAIDNE